MLYFDLIFDYDRLAKDYVDQYQIIKKRFNVDFNFKRVDPQWKEVDDSFMKLINYKDEIMADND